MAITDKTRKILWGRSGNRCAMCRRELVEGRTEGDDESVVGDECHIRSGQAHGPRYDPAFPAEDLHSVDNLVLMCRVHHKLIDDQPLTYTVGRLREIKAMHENWVSTSLRRTGELPPIKLRRIKQNVPTFLVRLSSGQDVMTIVEGACAYAMGHDELETEEEVELVGAFLQEAQDWGDAWRDVGVAERTRTGFAFSKTMKRLEQAGFSVFGGREVQRIEGGAAGPMDWPMAIIKVARTTNPDITRLDPAETVSSTKPRSTVPSISQDDDA